MTKDEIMGLVRNYAEVIYGGQSWDYDEQCKETWLVLESAITGLVQERDELRKQLMSILAQTALSNIEGASHDLRTHREGEMTKSEACRAIAERLPQLAVKFGGSLDCFECGERHGLKIPDFFDCEDHSARLLEAMPKPVLKRAFHKWHCRPDAGMDGFIEDWKEHKDRKTAIVLAACAWLGIEGELDG